MATYSGKHVRNANAIYLSCLLKHVTLKQELISGLHSK